MKKNLFHFTLLLAGLLFTTPLLAVVGQPSVPNGTYDGILVKFKVGVNQERMNRAFVMAGSQQQLSFRSRLVQGLTHAKIRSGRSLSATLRSLRNNRDVEFAEPNYILSAYVEPNDPRFDVMWGLSNTGQTGGVPDADIDAPEAWDTQTGSNVIIAVVDTGVDYNHADLSSNIWNNTAEIANNGLDDDGNGFVDDVRGWDFANNDNDPMDDNDHGTHLSGTIAASGNNGIGITGISWSARIMPIKFLGSTGSGSTASAISAIDYAVANGAHIINASWGGGPFSAAMFSAISVANDAGVIFIAAAGNSANDNDSNPDYPSSYNLPNIISVAATDDADTLASFSNFGVTSVDLGAPGVAIISTIRNNGYASLTGTSMAAPHVAGVAALIVASNPGIGVTPLRRALLRTDAVSDLLGRTVAGRLNAFRALTDNVPPPGNGDDNPAPVVNLTPENANVVVGNRVQFSVNGGTSPYVWSVANTSVGSISATGVFTGLAAGNTSVSATDTNGVVSNTASVRVTASAVLQVTPRAGSVAVGATLNFNASGGNPPYTWSVNDTTIALIDNDGVLTGQAAGRVIVTVNDSNNLVGNSRSIIVIMRGDGGGGMGGGGMGGGGMRGR